METMLRKLKEDMYNLFEKIICISESEHEAKHFGYFRTFCSNVNAIAKSVSISPTSEEDKPTELLVFKVRHYVQLTVDNAL